MYMKFRLYVVFVVLAAFSCTQKKSIVDYGDPLLSVDKLYGIGDNRRAMLSWEITSPATQLMLYRHQVPLFSQSNAVNIAAVNLKSLNPMDAFVVDSLLENGTVYYYTAVAEQLDPDGKVNRGTPKTITIVPFDPESISTDNIKYSEHIQTIFNSGCAIHGCHAGGEETNHLKLQKKMHGGSALLLRNWEEVLFGTDEVAQVVPYRATKSHLIQHLNADTTVAPVALPSMPPRIAFPQPLRDLFIRWINEGAKNDDGTVAYSTMPASGWLYVTNQGEDLTAVIDLDKNKIARYITTGTTNFVTGVVQSPHNVIVDWQNQFYYVNLIGGNRLLKFRVADNEKVGELSSGIFAPAQIAITRNSDTAYVTNFENNKTNITVVNVTTMTKLFDIGNDAMLKPHGVSLTPNFKYVVVCNSFSDNVTVIETSTNNIVAIIPIAANVPQVPVGYLYQYEPYQAVITPNSKFAYVTCRKSGEVRVVDLEQMKVTDSIKVGNAPLIPAITPNGEEVFVPNRNSNSISIINVASRTVVHTIVNVGVEPHGTAVSKDGKYLYVSCENLGDSEPPHHPTMGGKKPGFLKIIDIETRTVIQSLEVGNFAAGIAVTH